METINLILTHDTALTYWSTYCANTPYRYCTPAEAQSAVATTKGTITASDIRAVRRACKLFEHLPERIDLLVPTPNDHRTCNGYKLRSWTRPISSGMIVRPDIPAIEVEGRRFVILVVSPEMTFVEMARKVEFAELVEFGGELCGQFAIAPLSKYGLINLRPRTTPKRIEAFLKNAVGTPGVKLARKALLHLPVPSRSPKESQIAMLISLPRRHGGLAHRRPNLNRVVNPSPEIQAILGSKFCISDLSWGDQVVLEYDSYDFHDKEQAERDARKRNAYRLLGLDVVTMTYGQLLDLDTFTTLVESLGPSVVKRQRPLTPRDLERRRKLHWFLLHGARYPRFTDPSLVDSEPGDESKTYQY